jgi:hypothetical protein
MTLQDQCDCQQTPHHRAVCVFAASSLNSVAVRSKRVISIGLPIAVLSMRIDATR